MKRRTITAILMIATLVFLVFALVACAGQTRCAKHNWQPYKVVDGNIQTEMCSNCGVTRRLCYPFPHTYDSFADNGDGTHTAHCSECDLDDVVEHNFNGNQPTSIHDAVTCDGCGAKFYAGTNHQFVDGNGDLSCDICGGSTACNHNYEGEITTPAKCETSGVMTYTCTLCGDTYDETITATGHNYECEVVDATCLQDGYTLFTCSDCYDSYRTNIIPSGGHDEEIIVIKEATCMTTGLVTHKCTEPGCGYSYDESIALDRENGHVWKDSRGRVFSEEDICDGARIKATCILCQTVTTLEIESDVEHNWVLDDHAEAYTPPTCEENGIDTMYCDICDTYNEVYVDLLGHNFVKTLHTTDCTKEFGWSYYALICSECGMWDEGGDEQAEAKSHTDEDGDYICDVCNRSLCEYCEDMNDDHYCDACGKPYTEFCDDNDSNGDFICDICGNNFCQHYGFDWDYFCDSCGYCICNHPYTYQEFYGENCDDGGWLVYICGECSTEVSRIEIAHSEHAYEYYDYVAKHPTCTEDGLLNTEKYCYRCYYYVCEDVTIPAVGHNYVIVYMTESTCSRHGEILYCCANCGDLYIEELELSGHTAKTITLEASCFADGRTYEICSECGVELGDIETYPAYNAHINENGDYACDRCGWSYCDHHDMQVAYNQHSHYQQCNICNVIIGDITEHSDVTDEDGKCDECGACMHSFTVYEHDSLNHWSKCDNCDAVYICEHEHVEISRQEAMCGDFGGIIYGCSVCDHTFIVETEEATGEHINVLDLFDDEYHWTECIDCGLILSKSEHQLFSENDWYGCGTVYSYVEVCDGCDYLFEKYETAPGECDTWGEEYCWDCGKCAYHYGEEYDTDSDGVCDQCGFCTDDKAHVLFVNNEVESTCYWRGYKVYACENCNYTLKKDYTYNVDTVIREKLASGEEDWSISWFDIHDEYIIEVVEPNCGYNGYTLYGCNGCNTTFKFNYVKKFGEHINEDDDIWHCDVCDTSFCEEHIDEDENYRCDKCGDSTCKEHDEMFKSNHDYHWYECVNCNTITLIEKHYEEWYGDGGYGCSYCEIDHCEGFKDINGDNVCDRCHRSMCLEHVDEDGNYLCDVCGLSVCVRHEYNDEDYYCMLYYGEHCHICVNCGSVTAQTNHQDYDDDGVCNECGADCCDHYDYEDWLYGKDGICDYCSKEMSDCCSHAKITITGSDKNYHYGQCEDCGIYVCQYHQHSLVLEEKVDYFDPDNPCYVEYHYKFVCDDCEHIYEYLVNYNDHTDADDDYCCDECGCCW